MSSAAGQLRVIPPPAADVEVFHRALRAGRNGALVVGARAGDGRLVDVVVKPPASMNASLPHPTPSLFEWVGAAIARALRVSTPQPYCASISQEFASSVSDPTISSVLRRSVGLVFGSAFVQAMPATRGVLLDPSLVSGAVRLLAFDAFVHNVDRRDDNPNFLQDRERLYAIDHGDAFSFVVPTIGAGPAETDPLLGVVSRHAVFSAVKGASSAPGVLEEFRADLAALDDAWFAALSAATPSAWCAPPAAAMLPRIVDVLCRRRDAVDTWLDPIEALIR